MRRYSSPTAFWCSLLAPAAFQPTSRWICPVRAIRAATFLQRSRGACGRHLAPMVARNETSDRLSLHLNQSDRPTAKTELTMAFATTDDGVRLYYEETGSGAPIIFVHE